MSYSALRELERGREVYLSRQGSFADGVGVIYNPDGRRKTSGDDGTRNLIATWGQLRSHKGARERDERDYTLEIEHFLAVKLVRCERGFSGIQPS